MQELPDVSQLSDIQKDKLISLFWLMLQGQAKHLAAFQSQVAELQSKLNKKVAIPAFHQQATA